MTKITKTGDEACYPSGSCYPLAGEAIGVPATKVPSVRMRQVAAAIQIDICNVSDEDLSVNTIELHSRLPIAGKFEFNTLFYKKFSDDYNEYSWDDEWEEYEQKQAGPRFNSSVLEPANTVTLNAGGVVVEVGDVRSFFIPVAPTVFKTLGDDFSIKVNDVYKPVTMKPIRVWYGPLNQSANSIYIRHKFIGGKVTKFNFTYGFSDIQNTASVWSSLDPNGAKDKHPSWFYNSGNLTNFMACSATAKAQPFESSYSMLSYIWLSSTGYGNTRVTGKGLPYTVSLWNDDAFVFVIPVQHVDGGKNIAVETCLHASVAGEKASEHNDGTMHWWYGGAACFMCEYSLDLGKTWKAANLGDWKTDCKIPEGANFVIDNPDTSEYLKALCPIPSDFDQKTFLYRMRVVAADYDVDDIAKGAVAGNRTIKMNMDQYNEPDTYGGNNTLKALNGDSSGVYARVSVE